MYYTASGFPKPSLQNAETTMERIGTEGYRSHILVLLARLLDDVSRTSE